MSYGFSRGRIISRLAKLRAEVEASGATELDALLLLDDVCECLGLHGDEWRAVFGPAGVAYVVAVGAAPVRAVEKLDASSGDAAGVQSAG